MVLDSFYDRCLAPFSVNQMSTERTLAKLRQAIGGLSQVGEHRVDFRLYAFNPEESRLGDAIKKDLLKAFKHAREERRADQQAKRMIKLHGGLLDPERILEAFEERLREVRYTPTH